MKTTKKITLAAVLAAMAVVLVTLIHFPVFPAASFLEYDPGDIPIIIGTLIMGIPSGIIITIISSLVQGLTVSAQSGLYGIIMHIISTTSLLFITGFTAKKTGKLVLAAIVGSIGVTIVMGIANLIVTPLFMGVPVSVVKGMLLPVILPFNLLRAAVNSLISISIYKLIPIKYKERVCNTINI